MKSKMWQKFYECNCGTEGIVISHEYFDDEEKKFGLIDMAFFQHGFVGIHPLSFKERLRWCWHLLKTGQPFLDSVMLNKKVAEELGTDLLKWSQEIKEVEKCCKS